ncbi:MAG: hypothetical protein ACM3OF_15205 [Gemmatimonas sp.]|jgi:hypothetical protein
MMIARRADTRARADFATWKMIAKLNGASSLPANAQNFLASYKALLSEMTEADATEATIRQMYAAYYKEMGGGGAAPEVRSAPAAPVADNVTAFRRPAPRPKSSSFRSLFSFGRQGQRQQLPVALIFTCLVIVYVGIRYFWR